MADTNFRWRWPQWHLDYCALAAAIWKVHFKNGLTGNGGYEFPLALAAMAFGLLCFGGGHLESSFQEWIDRQWRIRISAGAGRNGIWTIVLWRRPSGKFISRMD